MSNHPSDPATGIRRILVLRTGHIGDVVLMTPALEMLSRLFPGAEISALVRAGTEPVLQHHPLIKRIYTGGEIVGQQQMFVQKKTSVWRRLEQVPRGLKVIRELRRQRFDLAIDFTGGDRTSFYAFLSGAVKRIAYTRGNSGFIGRDHLFTHICHHESKLEHKVLKDVELLRMAAVATGQETRFRELQVGPSTMRCSSEDVSWAREHWLKAAAQRGPRVVVHPASRVLYKCWESGKWSAVIRRLVNETQACVMVTSGPDRKELELVKAIVDGCADKVHPHLGDLTLGRLAALIQEADLFLGVDTAPMHMAAAVGTPVVAVFGPSQHERWGPWGPEHRVVRRPCPCLELRQRNCSEAEGMKCLQALTADEVYQAIGESLQSHTPR